MGKKYNPKELILLYTVTNFNSEKYSLCYVSNSGLKIKLFSVIISM